MGECLFWYQSTRVVSDKGPLNGCVCVCVCVFSLMTEWKPQHFSDVAVLLSKCEDVYSADVPSSLQVNNCVKPVWVWAW